MTQETIDLRLAYFSYLVTRRINDSVHYWFIDLMSRCRLQNFPNDRINEFNYLITQCINEIKLIN